MFALPLHDRRGLVYGRETEEHRFVGRGGRGGKGLGIEFFPMRCGSLVGSGLLEGVVCGIHLQARHSDRRGLWSRLRHLDTRFAGEIERGGYIEFAQSFAYSCQEDLEDGLLVGKLDFGLGGVDIDIYGIGLDVKIDEVGGVMVW